ncbi:MAG: hypothetical protein WDO69_07835 [Pseudomonadota bacterium]
MFRFLASMSLIALLLWSCGPDSPRACSGEDPDFTVVLKLSARPLPADTVVQVTYAGSAEEDYRLSDRNARHEVVFCQVADENGTPVDASAPDAVGGAGAAGAAGAGNAPDVVESLFCAFYTAGFTHIKVSGSGFETVEYDLAPKGDVCTVNEPLTLDSPDAG